jgi:tetratricopeptide (TPR) repeat protein
LAEGLLEAHSRGVMHRDIKPSNVLFAWSGRPMLLDFNLSSDAGADGQRIGGTLAYMAPEQIAGMLSRDLAPSSTFDPRSDIYSLGVVLYELLTSHLPAQPAGADLLPHDAYEAWLEFKRQSPPALRALAPEIDPRLAAIVLKCLSFAADERYGGAAELAAALRDYLGPGSVAKRFVKRHRRDVLLSGLGVVSLVFALAAYLGTRPPYHEILLAQGIAQYDRGEYDAAVETFSNCLVHKPGWPAAFFARGQALRSLEKWSAAHADYMALQPVNDGWACALAAYCVLRQQDAMALAAARCARAYRAGIRDIGFLLNFAHVERKENRFSPAVDLYTEVLALDPDNVLALRNRCHTFFSQAVGANGIPHEQGFADAEKACLLDSDSFESPLCAALIYAQAARKDPGRYEDQARRHLTTALERGMPLGLFANYEPVLKPLMDKVDPRIAGDAWQRLRPIAHQVFTPQQPARTANWEAFLRPLRRRGQLSS